MNHIFVFNKKAFKLTAFFLWLCFFNAKFLLAFELANNEIIIEEVLPLFNKHMSSSYVKSTEKGINKKNIHISKNVKLGVVNESLSFNGLIDETFFKDIVLKTSTEKLEVEIEVKNITNSEIKIIPKIVTSWYQAGLSTTKKSYAGTLTYELLLSDDRKPVIEDSWVKSNKGGWIYDAPRIKKGDILNTYIAANYQKRILFKIVLGKNVLPGRYQAELSIRHTIKGKKDELIIPIIINVAPIRLTNKQDEKYKLWLYTAFKINDQLERPKAYVNAARLKGTSEEREKLLFLYLADIKEHGFNGVTVNDWDSINISKTLKITNQLGIKDVILHATTPVNKKNKKSKFPIVNQTVKNNYKKHQAPLYFYGYDEVGGNKLLQEQLRLNQEIHKLGGLSVNAVFWSDMPNVISEIGRDKSSCFDIIAHSMGSHGNRQMFSSLPYKKRDDYCSKQGTKYVTYWHPHVENPVINRLYMGFWLWASGFDGVIPHGYYFPSHVERVITKDDIIKGVSNETSPYDDWAYWIGNLRHHNAVYPSKEGPVGTLQWEGILNGYMDLRYVLTLEEKLENPNVDERYKQRVNRLLTKIRSEVLRLNSPYMNDKDSLKYLKKLESWKKEITVLLLN